MSGERTSFFAVALALSVLINLFFLGVIVGRITLPGFRPPGQGPVVSREEIQALPDAERRAFVHVIHSHQSEMRALHEHVRDARRDAAEAIGAPTYDRKALEARFAAVRQAQDAQGTAQNEAVIEALGTLSPASRAAIARKAEENAEDRR
jgi:uncharacterized membrane protein